MITDIRVERLQDISREDAEAEGIKVDDEGIECWDYLENRWEWISPEDSFESLWDSINGKDESKNWNANPWVWVVEFERVS